ncbi:MAG: thioredoxin family protein [Bacteroidia bacterium]|nr:thioredoxin family protein [Bacteroidia bacterium]
MLRFCILSIALWGALMPAAFAGDMPVILQQTSLKRLQSEALLRQAPMMVYVEAVRTPACRRMDRHTWADPALAGLIAERFVSARFDGHSGALDLAFMKRYLVYTFPTVLIFSPEGKIMGKVEGFVSAETLAGILHKHLARLDARKPQAASAPLAEASRSVQPAPERLLVTDLAPASLRMASRGEASPRIAPVAGYEAQALSRLEPGSSAYALLAGAWTDRSKLDQEYKRTARFWRGELWVYAEDREGTPVYCLALGRYGTQEEARSMGDSFRKAGLGDWPAVSLGSLVPGR